VIVNVRKWSLVGPLCLIATLLSATGSAWACSYGGSSNTSSNYSYAYQDEGTVNYYGLGGYIYSTQTSINDTSNNHVVYSFAALPGTGSCSNMYEEIGRIVGNALGDVSTSPTVFTFNPNPYVFTPAGNTITCSSGVNSSALFEYGTPSSNEGYWTYPTGYRVLGDFGEGYEYQYRFDYGSLGSHAPNDGWSTVVANLPETNSEVYQGNAGVACESMSAYWGTNNGTPSTTYQLALTSTMSSSPTFSQWTDSHTQGHSGLYTWSEFSGDNYWAAHSYGSPS
jgi:hypothetical protein